MKTHAAGQVTISLSTILINGDPPPLSKEGQAACAVPDRAFKLPALAPTADF